MQNPKTWFFYSCPFFNKKMAQTWWPEFLDLWFQCSEECFSGLWRWRALWPPGSQGLKGLSWTLWIISIKQLFLPGRTSIHEPKTTIFGCKKLPRSLCLGNFERLNVWQSVVEKNVSWWWAQMVVYRKPDDFLTCISYAYHIPIESYVCILKR